MATKTFKENAVRVIAVLGLVAILVLGAWGIIQLAFFISSLFGTLGGQAQNAITARQEVISVSLPQSVTSGTNLAVQWTHQGGAGNYAYTVSYSCATGLSIKAPTPAGTMQSVPCDTAFNYTQATQSLSVTPTLAGTSAVSTTITVAATQLQTGAITAHGSAAVTINPVAKAAVAAPVKKATASSVAYVAGGKGGSPLFGYPDLMVQILSATAQGGNVTVQFSVKNVGTNVSPSNWSFSALLPGSGAQGSYPYPSGPQQALYPGDKIVYTLNFSAPTYNSTTYSPYPYANPYTYGTCNQYGPCAVPGYSGGYLNYNNGCTSYGYNGSCISNYYNSAQYYNYGPGYSYNRTGSVTIQVDPYNQVLEVTKANNYATATFSY